jgi:hypothetical protein
MTVEKKEDFMTTKWRPMMAMTYMATIIFDFIVGPIIFNVLQYWNPGQAVTSWTPLTLQGGGLYHLAMGAILGISALTRGQEKIAQINAGGGNNDPVPPAPVMGLPTGQTWQQPQQQQPMQQAPMTVDVTVGSPPPAFGTDPTPATRTTPTRKIV